MNSVLPSTNFENKPFDSGFDETVEVTEKWRAMNEQERQQAVISFLSSQEKYKSIQVSSADERGHVVLLIEESLPPEIRGLFLLDLELKLKNHIDEGLTIWLEPFGDRSKLRALRGVSVK